MTENSEIPWPLVILSAPLGAVVGGVVGYLVGVWWTSDASGSGISAIDLSPLLVWMVAGAGAVVGMFVFPLATLVWFYLKTPGKSA